MSNSPDCTKDNLKQLMSLGGDSMLCLKEKMDKHVITLRRCPTEIKSKRDVEERDYGLGGIMAHRENNNLGKSISQYDPIVKMIAEC